MRNTSVGTFASTVFLAGTGEALARSVRLDHCVVTIGSFCPVETVGITLVVGLVLLGAGVPLRWAIRRYVEQQHRVDPDYRPTGGVLFVYERAGVLTLGLVAAAVAVIVLGAT